jgi:DNA-binding transcriptional ArsR family regulator
MTKVTLDMTAFKALASDTRLSILRALDGKKLNLKELCKVTELNKATLHEHLIKLNEAGLVKKKEREGHKWVYYKLTWKGEGLLHPENTRIVVMFSVTFVAFAVGIIQMFNYLQGKVVDRAGYLNETFKFYTDDGLRTGIMNTDTVNNGVEKGTLQDTGNITSSMIDIVHDPTLKWISITCIVIASVILSFAVWRYWKNKTPTL